MKSKRDDDARDDIGVISDGVDVISESEDDFYKQVQEAREAKIAAKAEMYSKRSSCIVWTTNVVESGTMDRRRHITRQMEKNRGLTRARKKAIKNPRKTYKMKHQKAVEARKGQVREVKKPIGRYGGEASGINAGISRSTRFTN